MLEMSPGLVEECFDINDDLLLSYDGENKIVAVELYFVSKLLHEFSVQKGRPRFTFNTIYHEDSDTLRFNFVNFTPPMIEFKKTEDEDVEVGMDNAGKVVSLLFHNASNRLLKTLSEEERAERKKRADERRDEYAKNF
jgi:uncharacterized protein YuzE